MTPEPSDEALVRRAQQGDREAFLALYNRYLDLVYARVRSRVPLQDVEDVTQEVFIAVVRSLRSFEHRSRFSTWLYTIVSREIADYYRRHARGGERGSVSLDDAKASLPAAALDVDAEGHIDERVLIQRALSSLPEHYQEVILLRFVDGLSFAEIAEQRQQSFEATKSLYRRAIEAIRRQIGAKV